MPRNMVLVVERSMVQTIVPGTRVNVMGIFSINQSQNSKGRGDSRGAAAIRQPYLRVVGIEKTADSQAHRPQFSDEEVRNFKARRDGASRLPSVATLFAAAAPLG